MAQQLARLTSRGAVAVDFASAEERVRLALTENLDLVGAGDAPGDRGRRLASGRSDQLAIARCGHLQLDVDAIGERPRDTPAIARDALWRAPAASAAVAAMAGIHRRDQLEASRKLHLPCGA